MPAAARLTDMHTCPMQIPGIVPIPHTGGPIVGPGVPTVLIGKLPAAVVGDLLECVGPPDSIIKGRQQSLLVEGPQQGWEMPRLMADQYLRALFL
jgi:uncharacterized Zn-binding protein involved in type VI secretion